MPSQTLTKTFAFATTAESFSATAGTNVVCSYDSTTGNPVGALKSTLATKNMPARVSSWAWSGTWEGLGIPADSFVTAIRLNSASVRCTVYTAGTTGNKNGPYLLTDSANTTQATLWAGRTFSAVDGAWVVVAEQADQSVPSQLMASTSSIKLVLQNALATANTNGATITTYDDQVSFVITYNQDRTGSSSVSKTVTLSSSGTRLVPTSAGSTAVTATHPTISSSASFSLPYVGNSSLVKSASMTSNVPGLVLSWNFEETSGGVANDSSGSNLSGTYVGTSTSSDVPQNVPLNTASRLFNGTSDYVSAAHNSLLSFINGQSVTLSAWIKPNNLNSYKTIIAKGRTNLGSGSYIVRNADAKLEFYFFDTVGQNYNIFSTSNVVLTVGVWKHIALVHTFGNLSSTKFYVNGELVPGSWLNGLAGATETTSTELWVGNAASQFFNGLIDRVKIHNVVLSQSEINSVMYEPFGGFGSFTTPPSMSSGSLTKVISHPTISSSASFAESSNPVTGSATLTTAQPIIASASSRAVPVYAGDLTRSITKPIISSNANRVIPVYTSSFIAVVTHPNIVTPAQFVAPDYATDAIGSRHPTVSASASFTVPNYNGTAFVSINHPVVAVLASVVAIYQGSMSITVSHPLISSSGADYSGTLSETTANATFTAAGHFDVPVYVAFSTVATSHTTTSASALFGTVVYSGTASIVISRVIVATSASFTVPVYTVTTSLSRHPALAASALFVVPVYSASTSPSVHPTISVSSVVAVPASNGTVSLSRRATLATSAVFDVPVFQGTFTASLATVQVSVTASSSSSPVFWGTTSVVISPIFSAGGGLTVPVYTGLASLVRSVVLTATGNQPPEEIYGGMVVTTKNYLVAASGVFNNTIATVRMTFTVKHLISTVLDIASAVRLPPTVGAVESDVNLRVKITNTVAINAVIVSIVPITTQLLDEAQITQVFG